MVPNLYPTMSMILKQYMDGQDLCGDKYKFEGGAQNKIDRRILGVMFQMQMLMMAVTKAASSSLDNGTD